MTFQPGFKGLRSLPKVSYLGSAQDTSTATTYTFSAFNIGTMPSLIVISAMSGATVSRTISGITVGGAAATQLVASSSGNNPIALFAISVAAGGTATIVVTLGGGSGLGCAIDAWALTGLTSTTPTTTNQAQASNPSATVTPSAGGIVIAAAISGAATTSTWSVLTKRSDRQVAASTTFTATSADLSAASGSAVASQVTFGSNTTPRIVVAAFR